MSDRDDLPRLSLDAKPGTEHSTADALRRLIRAAGKGGQISIEVEGTTIWIVAHTDPAEEWLRGLAQWLDANGVPISVPDNAVMTATVGDA